MVVKNKVSMFITFCLCCTIVLFDICFEHYGVPRPEFQGKGI